MKSDIRVAEGNGQMITLGIDTANQTLTIGVIEDQTVLGQIQVNKKKNHSLTLMPALDQLISDCQLTPEQIDRVAVSSGPGSYTGLRIGVTTAKTLAYTLNKELVGVSSLAVLAANCVGIDGIIVPMFDARRKNVYAGAYRWHHGKLETLLEDTHISFAELAEKLKQMDGAITFVGSDCHKFESEIAESIPSAKRNTLPLWDIPSGVVVAQLGASSHTVSDIQAFLPRYLKRVEAEEKWLETHTPGEESYVEKI